MTRDHRLAVTTAQILNCQRSSFDETRLARREISSRKEDQIAPDFDVVVPWVELEDLAQHLHHSALCSIVRIRRQKNIANTKQI